MTCLIGFLVLIDFIPEKYNKIKEIKVPLKALKKTASQTGKLKLSFLYVMSLTLNENIAIDINIIPIKFLFIFIILYNFVITLKKLNL